MIVSTVRVVTCVALLALGSAALAGGPPPDTDGDGVNDANDNCLLVFNPPQRDTDGDGFGNFCDADFDNNGIVNLADLALMKDKIFSPAVGNEDFDLNGDGGFINFIDLNLMKGLFFLPPGPGATNAAPTDITIDNTSVAENQAAGTAVGNFSTVDANAGDTHTYTLVAGTGDTDNGLFTIVGNQLRTNAVLNFEGAINCAAGSTCSVRVQTDDGNATFQKSFGIAIDDANDDPTDIALSNNSVAENQSTGTAVGNFSTTDEDTADSHTYSLVAGAGDTDNGQFMIVGNQLQTSAIFNYEGTCSGVQRGAGPVCSIRVQTSDGSGTFQESFAINITNANDLPTDIALDSNSVNENEPTGTAVGNFSTTDEDTGDSHTYSLVAGTGDTDNGQFMIAGNQLQTNAVLNFEGATQCSAGTTCSIRVQSSDGSGTFQKVFTVNILDVNDPPVGVNDNYDAFGNTRFQLVAALSGTTVVPPTVEFVGTVGDNDTDEDGDTVGAVAATVGTTLGGSATIDANGRFVYSPPAGVTATTDSFDYTPSDGVATAASTATVDIDLTNIVWYVDNSSPENPGTGTSDDPFRNLSSAGGPSLASETIFVYSGTQTTGITLKNNQTLLGEGVALVVSAKTLVDAGSRPVIANGAGTAITLGNSNTIRGLDISGSLQGIVGSSFGTLQADTMAISTSGGAGIDLTSGAGSVTFDSVSSSGSATSGIDLSSVSGIFTLGGGSISGSAGDAFDMTGSSAIVSYSGSISTNPTGLAVDISTQTNGSVTLSGNITSTGQGILLNNNSGGTINLTGDISLSTGAFSAFSATNGNTINVTGNNTITTTTGSGVIISNTTIGGSGVTFQSVTSTAAGTNSGIILADTGSGTFTVTGVGTTDGSGGTIANKTVDAIRLDNTGGPVVLENMIIQDIGNMGGGNNAKSGHDAIHGQNVLAGLTLDNMIIRRVSDNCVNGTLFSDGLSATTWNGLEIVNSLIEDCNRHHVAGIGDSQDEGAVRIQGLGGTVTVDNNMFLRAGSHFDLSSASSGTLSALFTRNTFEDAYKMLPSFAVFGEDCINLLVEGSATVDLTIGTLALPNSFDNCGISSIQVAKGTVPAGNATVEVIIEGNQFLGTDNNINPVFGNNPQGGVQLRAGPGGISTFDGIIQNNAFGISVGPDDRIGSTDHEIINANGLPGNVGLLFESGISQVRVNNNTFNGPVNAPWDNTARNSSGTQVSAAVLYQNNSYRGRDDYCCDSGFTFTVPGTPHRTKAVSGGKIDITIINDQFVFHDQFFEAGTETLTFENRFVDGTQCVSLQNVTSPDGFEFEEDFGTIDLYQGAVNNAATGPCVAGSTTDCQNELADDTVRGGPNGYNQSGGPNATLNPPFVDVDGGSISIVGTACTVPSGSFFN